MITCVIPVFNEPKERIHRSVKSALDANFPRVMLVDDGSDEPVVYANNRVYVRRLEKNSGPAAAYNAGIEASRDDYIAFLDCGDVFFEEKWQQVEWTMQNAYRATFSRCIDELTGEVRHLRDDWQKAMFMDNQFQHSTIVFNRNATGYLDESLRWGSDNEFHARVQRDVGWKCFDVVTGTATAWPDGDTATADPEARRKCQRDVMALMRKYKREAVTHV